MVTSSPLVFFLKKTSEDKRHRISVGRMSVLSANQPCQSTEVNSKALDTMQENHPLTFSFIDASLESWQRRKMLLPLLWLCDAAISEVDSVTAMH